MRRSGQHQHNRLTWQDAAHAMDHRAAGQRPARLSFGRDAAKGAFRHAGIMFEHHGRQGVIATAHAEKAGDTAHICPARGQRGAFRRHVKQRFLHQDTRHGSAPGYGREEGNLIPCRYRMIRRGEILIDGGSDLLGIGESRRMAGAAGREPFAQPGDITDFRRRRHFFFRETDLLSQPGEI